MKTLFIQGPEKTATSTITGILNCHPEIFILFENYVAQTRITKYGNQLLERYPDLRQYYRYDEDYGKPLKEIYNHLSKQDESFSYNIFGTKINSLDPGETQRAQNYPVIFTMRDIKSWLIKESVIKIYRTDLDVVIPAIDYLRYIINTHNYRHTYKLWMEDLIEKNDEVIEGLSGYLSVDLKPHTNNWWDKIGSDQVTGHKSVFRLGHVHHSSRMKPTKIDTKYNIENHPFWNDLDKIFSKYYLKNEIPEINEEEILSDISSVNELKKYAPLSIHEAYTFVHSVRFGFKEPREVIHHKDHSIKSKSISFFKRKLVKVKNLYSRAINKMMRNKKWMLGLSFYDEMKVAFELFVILN